MWHAPRNVPHYALERQKRTHAARLVLCRLRDEARIRTPYVVWHAPRNAPTIEAIAWALDALDVMMLHCQLRCDLGFLAHEDRAEFPVPGERYKDAQDAIS